MIEYSKEANDWFENMRISIRDRIETYNELNTKEKCRYSSLRDFFLWSIEDQEFFGYAGAIDCDVSESWDFLSTKARKELGGKKSEADKLMAILLRDEFDVDIVEETNQRTQPCYRVHEQVTGLDWELDEEKGYKKLAKLIRDKNLDQGSALELYWGFCPEFYTQYKNESEIERPEPKKAFKLLKKLEHRLLSKDFKTNLIPFTPEIPKLEDNAKWVIPDSLTKSNLDID